jgi:CxxC motif-containing protein
MTKRPPDYYLLWLAVLFSLGIGVFLVVTLGAARGRAVDGLRTAAESVRTLRGSSIDYVIRVEQSVPVSITVPFSTTIVVPVNTTLPIDTEFKMTLRTVLGDYPVTVPVQSSVPVNFRTSVPIGLSIPVSASVPFSFSLPVRINLSQTALGTSLEQMESNLNSLAAGLQAIPFAPPASP